MKTKIILSALACLMAGGAEIIAQGKPQPFEAEIKAFEARDKTNAPPQQAILFTGSSTIRKWTMLGKDFPGKTVINRGFGGSQIADATGYAERIVFPYHPKQIVFYSGDNDLATGKSVEQVVADYQAFIQKVQAELPQTRIAIISIKPCPARWKLRVKVAAVNERVKAICAADKSLAFINIAPLMVDAEGKARTELFEADGLHPNRKCYEEWAEVIKPYLEKD